MTRREMRAPPRPLGRLRRGKAAAIAMAAAAAVDREAVPPLLLLLLLPLPLIAALAVAEFCRSAAVVVASCLPLCRKRPMISAQCQRTMGG